MALIIAPPPTFAPTPLIISETPAGGYSVTQGVFTPAPEGGFKIAAPSGALLNGPVYVSPGPGAEDLKVDVLNASPAVIAPAPVTDVLPSESPRSASSGVVAAATDMLAVAAPGIPVTRINPVVVGAVIGLLLKGSIGLLIGGGLGWAWTKYGVKESKT